MGLLTMAPTIGRNDVVYVCRHCHEHRLPLYANEDGDIVCTTCGCVHYREAESYYRKDLPVEASINLGLDVPGIDWRHQR